MDNNLFAIDRFEDNIVVLENIKTMEQREVHRCELPSNIREGAIVKFYNNNYILEEDEEEKRRREILERFQNLRKKN